MAAESPSLLSRSLKASKAAYDAFRGAPSNIGPGPTQTTGESKGAPGAPTDEAIQSYLQGDPRVRLGVYAHTAGIGSWPQIDRYPTVQGAGVTLQYIASQFRTALTGYRQQYVDMLNELLERDGHMYAVITQRILTVVGRPIDIVPPKCQESETELAALLAEEVQEIVDGIDDLEQSLGALQWAIYYGPTALENTWGQDHKGRWVPLYLHFLFSRRIAYPDPFDWAPHLWDQGYVGGAAGWNAPSQRMMGIRLQDYPGKFILHSPQVRGDYPTREGLGRQMAIWSCLKGMGARGAAQYVERFGKPWTLGSYKTGDNEEIREATPEDKDMLNAALVALGAGGLNGATLPDSVKIEMSGPGLKGSKAGMSHEGWIAICNAEMSKIALSQTFTTESGKYGSRATADVGEGGFLRLARADAAGLGRTLRRDLIQWIVRLNWPELLHLTPHVQIRIEDEPDPKERIGVASTAAAAGIPVDADAMAQELGLPVIPNETGGPRRMAPLKPTSIPELALGDEAPIATPGMGNDNADDGSDDNVDSGNQQSKTKNQPTPKAAEDDAAE